MSLALNVSPLRIETTSSGAQQDCHVTLVRSSPFFPSIRVTLVDSRERPRLRKRKKSHQNAIHLQIHGVWKSQKKSYSTLRAKRATLTYQVLPDRSILKGQKLTEHLKWDILSNLQKMCKHTPMVKMYSICNWKVELQSCDAKVCRLTHLRLITPLAF